MTVPQQVREVVVSLIGLPLEVLLGVLTVAMPVTTYLLWSRVRGRAAVVVRAGLLLASQACAVLLLAALANDYGYFYTSWSELFGATSVTLGVQAAPPAPSTSTWFAAGRATRDRVTVRSDLASWSTPAQWATRGRLQSVDISGARSGLSEHAYVYLPPQYFARASEHARFPGVEVMTGYPGHEQSLVTRMHYPDVLLAGIRSGRVSPMVLVLLRPSVTEPRDTECTDVPAGPQALTYFAQDVPTAVSAHWRVRPVGWAAVGDSTGGYCATKMAMTQSDIFTAAVSFSGYYHALKDATTGDLWGGSPVLRELNDPVWRLKHLPQPPIGLFASIGSHEGGAEGYASTMQLKRAVVPSGSMRLTVVVVPGGGHSFDAWSGLMPRAFSWLSAELAKRPA